VVVKNGTIRGSYSGVQLATASTATVEGIHATGVYRDDLTASVSDPYLVLDGAGVDAGNDQ